MPEPSVKTSRVGRKVGSECESPVRSHTQMEHEGQGTGTVAIAPSGTHSLRRAAKDADSSVLAVMVALFAAALARCKPDHPMEFVLLSLDDTGETPRSAPQSDDAVALPADMQRAMARDRYAWLLCASLPTLDEVPGLSSGRTRYARWAARGALPISESCGHGGCGVVEVLVELRESDDNLLARYRCRSDASRTSACDAITRAFVLECLTLLGAIAAEAGARA